MPISIFGQECSIMRIGSRQLKLRGPKKANKANFVIKRKSVPSHTVPWLRAAIAFSEAAHSARGGTLEDVVLAVKNAMGGKDFGGKEAATKRRELRLAGYEPSIATMRRELEAKSRA